MGLLIGRRCLQCFALVGAGTGCAANHPPMHHGAGCYRGGPQRPVGGDILTARPILWGMAKTALPLLLSPRRADQVMRTKRLPAGFVVPAQPVKASKPSFGAEWVHEIKHDGYRDDRPPRWSLGTAL
jgi:hypothetical protein